jgi:superfamily II RNA helicase
LFATETFAVGVNMPTRTVVMTELDKYTDEKKRYLMPSEYKQMSGRAGRRGIDTVGHVIILPLQDIPEEVEIRNIVLGNNTVIKSRIKIDNKIILKILSIGDDINSVMSETLFASENDGIIKTAMKDLDGLLASDKYNESCKNVENMKNIKDIEMLYKLSNTQQVFNGFAVSMSKEQQKKQQKLIKTVNTSDYNKYSEYILINKEISKLKELISENTQYLNNAVENIIEYLIENNYVMKETNELTLKGVMASKINECNPVLLTEMIIQDIFNGLSAPEIVALLAIFIEPEHNNPAKENYNEINIIINKISRINEIIKYHNSKYNQEWEIYNDFIHVAYLWASQLSLNEITEITGINVYIGQFAKNIIKISNIASDMIYLCELSEKIHLIPELNKITGLLIRDFITFSSLYLS